MQTCSHIKADGALWRAIPMKNKTRCYFHQQAQTRQRSIRHSGTLTMPVIEDVPSIQLALMDVVNRLAQGTTEPRNAGLILYALQIASSNLRTGRFTSKGWQDYHSKNTQLVTTEEVEERSQSASEVLVQMLPRRREECMAEAAQEGLTKTDDLSSLPPTAPEQNSTPSPLSALISSLKASAEDPRIEFRVSESRANQASRLEGSRVSVCGRPRPRQEGPHTNSPHFSGQVQQRSQLNVGGTGLLRPCYLRRHGKLHFGSRWKLTH